MNLVLLCAAIVVVCMPCWLAPLTRRLDPRENIRVFSAALVLGALLIEASLILFAIPATLIDRGHSRDSIGRCLFGNSAPGGLLVGSFAAAFAVLLPLLGYQAWRRTKRVSEQMRPGPSIGVHQLHAGIDVVRLPTDDIVAYSIDGAEPQVVVSDGLVALLAPDELDVVVSHELAHLNQRHGRVLRTLAALEAAIPFVRWTTTSLRVAIERCADEAAVRRDPLRRESLLNALLKVSCTDMPVSIAAFTRRSGVLDRAEALLVTPLMPTRTERILDRLVLATAAVSGIALVCAAAFGMRTILCVAGICCR